MLYLDCMVLCATDIRCHGLAAFQFDDPAMQRTGHALAVHDALCQWAAFVRAAVVQRENVIVLSTKYCNFSSGGGHDAGTLPWNVIQFANLYPVQCVHLVGWVAGLFNGCQ